jgi:hypothetical protein
MYNADLIQVWTLPWTDLDVLRLVKEDASLYDNLKEEIL